MFSTRIPTIIGLLLTTAIVAGVIVAFESYSRLSIRATESTTPANIQITNLSDTNATFTWTTQKAATGAVLVTYPQGTQTLLDERDTDRKLHPYTTHSVTIRNLKGSSEYAVKILSNGKTYLENGDKPYRIRTSPTLTTSPPDFSPSFGSIMMGDNQPAVDALVFLTIEGSQMLSTVVKPSGAWIIPLNRIRTENGSAYLPLSDDRITETILVKNDGLETSAITDTLNDSPVPAMILGKDYDFRKQQAKAPSTVLGAQTNPTTVSLVAPGEGTALTSVLPLIQGTGIPSKSVTVTLGIMHPISSTTTVGSDGVFRFTPQKPLAPGKQSVTIMTLDKTDKPIAITHSFEILKSGTQVLGLATPSSTLAPTPISTLSGQSIPESATTFPTVMFIVIGLTLVSFGALAFLW